MKNFILLNYNIKIDNIYYKNNEKYFFINEDKIYIMECKDDNSYLEKIFRITNDLYYQGIKVNTFIVNNKNKFFTNKDDKKIILIKENSMSEISLNYIKKFQNKNISLEDYDVLDEWIKEVDMLEKEITEYNKEYPLIKDYLDFFIGLAENAIELLTNYKNIIKLNNNSIGHIINYKYFLNLNDPFSFIKTNEMYDVSNYIKYMIITNRVDYNNIDNVIKNNNEYQNAFLFSCLLYPTIFFEYIKNILLNNIKEDSLNIVINRINRYLNILSYCQNNIKNVKDIEIINWFNK